MDSMNKSKYLRINFRNKTYEIEYKVSKTVLYFKDKNGGSIVFVRKGSDEGFSIFVDDKYNKDIKNSIKNIKDKKHKESAEAILKGFNSYTLAPEQIKILKDWIDGIF